MEAVIHPDVIDGDREYGIMGLAFCGAELRASSVVVPGDVTTDSDIENIIIQVRWQKKILNQVLFSPTFVVLIFKQMKDRHIQSPGQRKRASIGFMVACIARGTNIHGQSGVESAIFRKHFPTTPLLGFFGNGEIGINCLGRKLKASDQAVQSSSPSAPKKSRTAYLHSYATTFIVVSFPVDQ